jgi:hypothetical protein
MRPGLHSRTHLPENNDAVRKAECRAVHLASSWRGQANDRSEKGSIPLKADTGRADPDGEET